MARGSYRVNLQKSRFKATWMAPLVGISLPGDEVSGRVSLTGSVSSEGYPGSMRSVAE